MTFRHLLLATLMAATGSLVGAVDRVEVQALFKDRAVLLIDGKRRLLSAGETSPEGVTLVRSNSRGAEIRVDGTQRELKLGNRIGSNFQGPREQTARVHADAQGMYITGGAINGIPVSFVLDTGSTLVSISERLAVRLGLDYKRDGRASETETAAGIVRIWRIPLARVKLGEIELTDVEAAVLEGDFPSIPLLGNSFLGRLEMTRSAGAVVLTRKF